MEFPATSSATPSTPTATSFSMPNVEHLLQHYKVADVLHIQRRLKGDVEKRKADLKALIGERYNELLEATDSIELMSGSVASLIVSLKELGGVLSSCTSEEAASRKKKEPENQLRESSLRTTDEYSEAVLSKLLFDLPLQVWNALEQGRITFATYSYFYGLFLYRKLRSSSDKNLNRLHFYNQRAIEDLAGHIVEHCWRRLALEQRSPASELDLSTFADTFSCICLLSTASSPSNGGQPAEIIPLVEEFYRRQAANITAVCSQPSQHTSVPLSALLETLLNIITNTVKCSRLFYVAEEDEEEEGEDSSLLPQRFHRLVTATYGSFARANQGQVHQQHSMFKDSRSQLLQHLQQYQIATDFAQLGRLSLCPRAGDSISAWVASVTAQLTASLVAQVEATASPYSSIRTLYGQLEATEERHLSGASFRDWEEEYGAVVDVRSLVWTGAIKRAVFERRVQALAGAKTAQAVQALEERLLLAEAAQAGLPSKSILLTEESSVVPTFVWRGSIALNAATTTATTATSNSSHHHLTALVAGCLDLLEGHLAALYEDLAPLKQQQQQQSESSNSSFLGELLSGQLFTGFLADLQQRINRLHLSSTATNQWLLFGALLFEKLAAADADQPLEGTSRQSRQTSSSSSYRKLFEDLVQHGQQASTTWTTVQAELGRISDSYFCRWFELVVAGHLATFTPDALVELTAFLANLTAWQRVPIASGGGSEGSTTTSTSSSSAVEVPTTISLCLQTLLEAVCGDINRQSGYRLSSPVLAYIVSLLCEQLLAVYEGAVKGRLLGQEAESSSTISASYPPAAKQTIAIQLYFDLLFLRACLSDYCSPELQQRPKSAALKRLNELKTVLESSLIDPFDLHLMFPALVANAERHLRASSVLFAFLFTPSGSSSASREAKSPAETAPPNQAAVRHNIMLVVPPAQPQSG